MKGSISDLKSSGLVALIVLSVMFLGIPKLIKYLENKDIQHREDQLSMRNEMLTLVAQQRDDLMKLVALHREDIKSLLATNLEERNTLYSNIGIKVDRICDQLNKMDKSKNNHD